GGTVWVCAPLPGVVSVRSTGSVAFAPPPHAATAAVPSTDSRIVTVRRPPDMRPIIPRAGRARKGRRPPLRHAASPLGPPAAPTVLRHGNGRGRTVMAMPADTRLWHPFADMHAVRGAEIVITRGEGAYVWDADSRRYLDGTASLWNVNVGHGREEIVDAAAAQMRTLASYSAFGAFANTPALRLAARLAELAPGDAARIFFGSAGGRP